MSHIQLSLLDFMQRYHDEDACVTAFIRARWPNGPKCPKCGCEHAYRMRTRRIFQCSDCKHQMSITAGTILHGSKLPLAKWFLAFYLVGSNKQGISALSLGKHLGISRVSAWHLLHKIRSAMKESHLKTMLNGLVCVDEGYVGGGIKSPHESARSTKRKSPIIALVEERSPNRSGSIHIETSLFLDREACHGTILDYVEQGSTIRTDGWNSYRRIGEKGYVHRREMSRRRKAAISQFALVHRAISNFKNWLNGCFRNSCQRHLDRYAAEFCWRTNRRNRSKEDRKTNAQEGRLFSILLNDIAQSSKVSWEQLKVGWRDAYA